MSLPLTHIAKSGRTAQRRSGAQGEQDERKQSPATHARKSRLRASLAPTRRTDVTTQSRKSYLVLSAFEPNRPLTTLHKDTR